MKYKLCRWDDEGNMFRPKWDGTQWRWYSDGSFLNEVPEPTDYTEVMDMLDDTVWVQAWFWNDDGTTPDPRTEGVTRRLRLSDVSHTGRPKSNREIRDDINFWLKGQPAYIMEALDNITKKPKDRPRHNERKRIRI